MVVMVERGHTTKIDLYLLFSEFFLPAVELTQAAVDWLLLSAPLFVRSRQRHDTNPTIDMSEIESMSLRHHSKKHSAASSTTSGAHQG
jgi:hypothetical protein